MKPRAGKRPGWAANGFHPFADSDQSKIFKVVSRHILRPMAVCDPPCGAHANRIVQYFLPASIPPLRGAQNGQGAGIVLQSGIGLFGDLNRFMLLLARIELTAPLQTPLSVSMVCPAGDERC
jgi:hypothetical protein